MDIIPIIKEYNIGYQEEEGDKLYNLDDIIINIIQSKDYTGYVKSLKRQKINIIKKNGICYLLEDDFIHILHKSNSSICKEIITKIKQKYKQDNNIQELADIFCFNDIEIFVYEINGKAWFKGIEIARILEYSNTNDAILNNVKDKHKDTFENIMKKLNPRYFQGVQFLFFENTSSNTIMINESGLYSLIFKSKMKKAEIFTDWVTEEVLPSIRKKGVYINNKNNILMDLRDYKNKYCVYLFEIGDNIYKYGDTINIRKRMSSHKSNYKTISVIKIFTFDSYEYMKSMAHKVKKYIHNIDINYKDDKNQVELFKTTSKFNIDDILVVFNSIYKTEKEAEDINNNNNDTNNKINIDIQQMNNIISTMLNNNNVELLKDYMNTMNLIINNNQNNIIHNNQNNIINNNTEKQEKIKETTQEIKIQQIIEIKKNRNVICPKCNKNEMYKSSKQCVECAKFNTRKIKDRPSKEQLQKDLEKSNFVQVGKKYGVSDNCIRKWLR